MRKFTQIVAGIKIKINDRWGRTFYISAIVAAAIAGEWFHMIAMIAAFAEVFFFLSDHSDGSDHIETGI